MILVLKITKKYTHNMILMSRYKGQLHGEKGPTNSGKALHPPFQKSFFFWVVFPNSNSLKLLWK